MGLRRDDNAVGQDTQPADFIPRSVQEYYECPWVTLGRSVSWFESRARYPSKVRMIAVDAEIRQWSRRRAVAMLIVARIPSWC